MDRRAAPVSLAWTWRRLDALAPADVYDWLALRSRVFVVEQACLFQDPDGLDGQCFHLLGRDAAGTLIAGLRVVDPGVKYEEPSIGRVITAPEARGGGLGRVLMQEGIARCSAAWPGRPIRIGAQSRLEVFYASLGFERIGADYIEDGIPHCEMRLETRRPA